MDGYGLDLSGWMLQGARDVSADGAVIVGYGINPAGEREGWVAVIPEPQSLALVGLLFVICHQRVRTH